MGDITWGPEILVGGVRPDWLGEYPGICDLKTSDWTNRFGRPHETPSSCWAWTHGNGEPCITAIRLPADHFAYVAIDKGFEPWGGGDAAPEDWDGGDVLLRNSRIVSLPSNSEWQRGYKGDPELYADIDIIGYRKRTEQPSDTVMIARMTEAEAIDWIVRKYGLDDRNVLRTLRTLCLIRPETLAERFTRETGHEATRAVLAALAWDREVK